ncbi:MAG: hypothetical protein FGM41_00845 [Bacteroidetes bacterium]|nr:hypothetical protein [Bacteroidota bacterium]
MKKSLFNILGAAAMLGITLSSFQGCKIGDPLEGVAISIKADAVAAPSELIIRDAKNQTIVAGTVPVTISGPGAPYVYSSGASKTIFLFEGAISFSIRKGTPVSASNPIKFTVNVNLPGYLPLEYPITLTSLDPIRTDIYVVSFDNPPAGAKGEEKTVTTGSDGKTTDTSSISIPATAEKTEALKIAIEAGTQLLDKDGQPVTGAVEAKVLQFTTGTKESYLSFPGGFDFSGVKDANGNPTQEGSFEPAGWIDMSMTAGGKSVTDFSKPLNVSMEISEDQINPLTQAKYKSGDVIDIYSKSEGENWVKEGTATIALNSNNRLEAQMPVKHLSNWAVGIIAPNCGQEFILKIGLKVGYSQKILNISEIYTMDNTFIYIPWSNTYIIEGEYPGGQTHNLNTEFIPKANSIYELVLDNVIIYEGKLCGTLVDAGDVATPGKVTSILEVKCTNGSQIILPENYTVYYINEATYLGSANPNDPAQPGRRVAPRDGAIVQTGGGTVEWLRASMETVTIDGKTYNKLQLPETTIENGQKYRFSVYYNDGSKETREDYITETIVDKTQTQQVSIMLSKCPI